VIFLGQLQQFLTKSKKKVFGVRGATTLRQLSIIDSLSITGEHMHFAAMSVFLVVAISWCSYHDPFVSG